MNEFFCDPHCKVKSKWSLQMSFFKGYISGSQQISRLAFPRLIVANETCSGQIKTDPEKFINFSLG